MSESASRRRVRCDPLTEVSVALHEIGNLYFLNALVFSLFIVLVALWFHLRGRQDSYFVDGILKQREAVPVYWTSPDTFATTPEGSR